MCMVGLGINSLLLAVSMCFFDIHKALVRQRRETDNVETGRRKVRVLWVGGSLPDGCFNIKHETARCLRKPGKPVGGGGDMPTRVLKLD